MVLGLILLAIILLLIGRMYVVRHQMKSLVIGFLLLNLLIFVSAFAIGMLLWLGTPQPAAAATPAQTEPGLSGLVALSAALSTGLAALGAGIAVGISGSAAIGGISEKPEIFGRALVFVGLAEGIAIYGLIISFFILTQ